MPSKPISDRQRLITYAAQCGKEELLEAIETFQAIFAGRFPKEPRKSARGQKRVSKPAPAAQAELPTVAAESADEERTNGKHYPRRKVDKFVPDPHMVKAIEENKRERIPETEMMED